MGSRPALYITKKGALDSQLQVINFSSLLAHGRWFSPGIPASYTTKTGRHDITEVVLNMSLKYHIAKQLDSWKWNKRRSE